MKKEKLRSSRRNTVSRRRFLALGSLGAVSVWASSSGRFGARMVRGIVADAGRNVSKAGFIPTPSSWNPNAITAAWLGHSSVLLNFFGVNILTDPVLCKRIGANTMVGNVGPKRLVAPALNVRHLPAIDLVLLSHAHMDHLDPATLRALPGKPQVVTAHATLDLLEGLNLGSRKALRWNESTQVATTRGDLEIKAFEVKHWGARWKVDQYRGYNGYVVSRGGRKIIFGGDTAMTSSFSRLRKSGPYEFAIMPIGAYQPWINSHCTPEQAVQINEDAGAKYLLPVHFKTFPFGREATAEPLQRLEAAMEGSRIGWRDVGQTFTTAA